jgi:uncharacterized protein (TIGR02246 family)
MSTRSRTMLAMPLVLTLAVASTAWTQDKAAEKASGSAVRAALEAANAKFTAAVKAGDVATAANVYTADAAVLAPGSPVLKGREAIAGMFGGWLSEMVVTEFTLTIEDLVVAGDYAIDTGTYAMTMKPKAGGDAFPDKGKYLAVWKRQSDGSWKLFKDAWNADAPPPGSGK